MKPRRNPVIADTVRRHIGETAVGRDIRRLPMFDVPLDTHAAFGRLLIGRTAASSVMELTAAWEMNLHETAVVGTLVRTLAEPLPVQSPSNGRRKAASSARATSGKNRSGHRCGCPCISNNLRSKIGSETHGLSESLRTLAGSRTDLDMDVYLGRAEARTHCSPT